MRSVKHLFAIALMTGWLVVAAQARAEGNQFAGVLPNGPVLTKPVESMQAARYRNLVRQQTDYS